MTIPALLVALAGWVCYLATPNLGTAMVRLGLCELIAIAAMRLEMGKGCDSERSATTRQHV